MLSNKVVDLSCFLEGTRSIEKLLKKLRTEEGAYFASFKKSLTLNYVYVLPSKVAGNYRFTSSFREPENLTWD